MTGEARRTFEKVMARRRESLAQRAVMLAFADGRNRAGKSDVKEAVGKLQPERRSSKVLAFFGSLLLCELITNCIAWVCIQYYFNSMKPEVYSAIGALLAASISSGGGLAAAFYRIILRNRREQTDV